MRFLLRMCFAAHVCDCNGLDGVGCGRGSRASIQRLWQKLGSGARQGKLAKQRQAIRLSDRAEKSIDNRRLEARGRGTKPVVRTWSCYRNVAEKEVGEESVKTDGGGPDDGWPLITGAVRAEQGCQGRQDAEMRGLLGDQGDLRGHWYP